MNENMSAAVETAGQTVDNATASQEVVAPAAESVSNTEQQATEGAKAAAESGLKTRQSKGVNAQYKANRQKAEAYDGISNGILGLARSKGLNPRNAEEAIRMLEADAKGQNYEEYLREQAAAEADLESRVKGSKFYKELEQRANQDRADAEAYRVGEQMRKDLEAIRQVDPTVESLESLGDEFCEAVRDGMDGLSAYYMIKGKQAAMAAAMPPNTGDVGTKTDTDRDFTSEELDRLNKELDDPKILQKALRSLKNLKKE